jgi:hypothetical protein
VTPPRVLVCIAAVISSGAVRAAEIGAVLPPEPAWRGASEALVASPDDPWVTPAEASGLTTTPRYAETIAWLQRLALASDRVKLVALGASPEGRAIWMAVVSAEGAATPAALGANGRPTLLAQAGIHAGEIEGKDAGLMLLRELTVGGSERALLERANLLFVPILNVDGHERFSPFTRINQRGPEEAGWRTTSANLNLNRDYAKLDAPETRAVVAALGAWAPDLYLDLHTTDGGDYQADVTFGWNRRTPYSPAIERWLESAFRPAAERALGAAGHVPGPLALFADATPESGILDWNAEPRFSTGYGALRHLPTVLVENHALKSYRRRVLGTYIFLAAALRVLGEEGAALRRAVAEDAARRLDPVPVAFGPAPGPPPKIPFAGTAWRLRTSEISGGTVVDWTARPVALEVPHPAFDAVTASVARPQAYWIPPAHRDVIERLALHGVATTVATAPVEVEVEAYRLAEPRLAAQPFEGRVPVEAKIARVERRRERLPAGAVRIATDQPLGELAIALLEPQAPDSFFRWGFLLACLQRTEYFDDYVLEPTARRMLAEDPELAREFEAKLAADPKFAADPAARLAFFYEKTPYADQRWLLYPVFREP